MFTQNQLISENSQISVAAFTPASRLELFSKAFAAKPDLVILDLEDAVAPADKASARENIRAFAKANPQLKFALRINPCASPEHNLDLELLMLEQISVVMLAKAESKQQLQNLYEKYAKNTIALLETATAFAQLSEIAQAQGLLALSYGALDLSLDLGVNFASLEAKNFFDQLALQMVIASKINGLQPPISTIYPNFSDQDGLECYCHKIKNQGFAGMLCIHPKQIATVRNVFKPSQSEIEWANNVINHYNHTKLSAFALNGEMIDPPVIKKAALILQQAKS